MKKIILSLGLFFFIGGNLISQSNINPVKQTFSSTSKKDVKIPTHFISTPNIDAIRVEDSNRDQNGMLYRIGVANYVNITSQNSGLWSNISFNKKVWKLNITSPGADALSFTFNNFELAKDASFWVENKKGEKVSKVLTKIDMLEDLQQHIALCYGDDLILVLETNKDDNTSKFLVDRVFFNYRNTGNPNPSKLNASGSCNVNVNCTEGTNYQDEKKGIARILITDGGSQGWCSGTLVNNTSQNCKPLFLTALHCGPTTVTADFNLWKFYFKYEAPTCTNPTSEGTLANNFITGCVKLASSNDNVSGNITKSDFLLLQLGTLANESTTITTLKSANFNAYWNGWDANNTASASGVGIHHPSGDFKKISTYTSSLVSTSYSGSTANTHWQANWVQTATNYGITEGGSSGSPLFTYNNGSSRVVGTLSGGASACGVAPSSANDLYGKMSYHWTTYGTTATVSLKYHLDPNNTGLLVLDGSSNPCSAPTIPVANFSADNTSPCIGSTVNFSDLSTGVPTTWAWSFNPTSVTYTGGTTFSSQYPKVQFNAAGPYTVTLVATNGLGNDSEIKTAYITPATGASIPFTENFEGTTFPPTGWNILNDDGGNTVWGTDGTKGFERRSALGNTSSTAGCAAINCFNYNSDATDALIVKSVSLSGANSPKMTFKRAYKYYNNPANYDELRVFVSTDCGATYGSAIYTKIGTQLATNGVLSTTFTPSILADWDTDTVDLTTYIGQTVLIKFEVTNKYGNNLYLDDINISSLTSTASVAISSNDTDNTICSGTSVTFTATPTNGGSAPTYQWKVNGSNVGTNSATYTSTSLTNGQIVTCVMTSNLSGVTGSPATSNAITMTVNATPLTPTITQNGSVLTSSSSTGNQWSMNSSAISGAINQTLTVTQSGSYTVTVTSNGCSSAASSPIVISYANVTITSSDNNNTICAGTSVTFTATPSNGGTSPSYQWKVNGANVGTNSSTYTTTSLTNGQSVTCVMTSNLGGTINSPATSNAIVTTVNSIPSTPTITQNGSVLTSSSSTGNQWSMNSSSITGAINQTLTVSQSGSYTVTVTTNGCSSSPSAPIAITYANVTITSSDNNNTICAGESITFTATPSNGGSSPSYQWKVNGANVGTNSSTYTTTSLTNGQSVTCVMTSNLGGAINTPATSNSISTTVNAIPNVPIISQTGDSTLTSSVSTGNQWTLNSLAINGAISQNYLMLQNGSYGVYVSVNGCNSDTSTVFVMSNLSVGQLDHNDLNISLFPNPTSGKFTLTFNSLVESNYIINLHDAAGRILFSTELPNYKGQYVKEFDLTNQSKGEYFMSITDSNNSKIEKVINH